MGLSTKKLPMIERLDRLSMPEPNSGCQLWLGMCHRGGYGYLQDRTPAGQINLMAHRASWECHHGPIPPGLCVCHKCDVPCCINPGHLFLGTRTDNNKDRDAKGRTVLVRGEQHGRHMLTVESVRLIRADTRRQSAIAEDHGITRSAVSAIKIRRTWRHV